MKVIAVDFDGTLCESAWPDIGKANDKLIDWLKDRQQQGDRVILWTCRSGRLLEDAILWCFERGLEFDAVNHNVQERQEQYGDDTRKVSADYYIEDRALWVLDRSPAPLTMFMDRPTVPLRQMPPTKGLIRRIRWMVETLREADKLRIAQRWDET